MLITSKTPLRISFFGGGTDYPEYYLRSRGAVLGMAIDKYIYISTIQLQSFLEYKYRVSYSRLERCDGVGDIEHPVVRAVLQMMAINQSLDLNVISELPASTGLGSSSAFTVGLINLIGAIRNERKTKLDLARDAIRVERELLSERVGSQDQFHAAFGGINRFDFSSARTQISPVHMSADGMGVLESSILLIYTGITRHASATLDEQLSRTQQGALDKSLEQMLDHVDAGVGILEGGIAASIPEELGRLLDETWQLKRKFSAKVTNDDIDELYAKARRAGAFGGKLCGAGSGGFLMVIVSPDEVESFIAQMSPNPVLRIRMDTMGSRVMEAVR